MIKTGILLDTGPLVSFFLKNDPYHEQAKSIFARLIPPFQTCEAVLAEACYLLSKSDPRGPGLILSFGRDRFFESRFSLLENLDEISFLVRKYHDQSISLADACLIRCAEIFNEPRIVTFDSDFQHYRWGRNRRFQIIRG